MPKIIQLDYDTREPVGTYDNIRLAANDNYLSYISLRERLARGEGTAVYNDKKLIFIKAYKPKPF